MAPDAPFLRLCAFVILALSPRFCDAQIPLADLFPAPPETLFCSAFGGATDIVFRPSGIGQPDDLIVANRQNSTNALTICTEFDNGAYTSYQVINPGAFVYGSRPVQLQTADLDLDGDHDVAVYWNSWSPQTQNQFFVLWFDGSNATPEATGDSLALSSWDYSFRAYLTLFDLDDDGMLDVVLNGTQHAVWNQGITVSYSIALLQWANHQFMSITPSMPIRAYQHHRDLDGDGKQDLLWRNSILNQVEHHRNLGGTQFELVAQYPEWNIPDAPDWQDANGDGVMDFVTVASSQLDSAVLHTRLVDDGLLTAPEQLFSLTMSNDQQLARDLDNDGNLDLIIRSDGTTYLGAGDGSLAGTPIMSVIDAQTPQWTMLPPHDVDADGDLDLILKSYGCVAWIENHLGEVGIGENAAAMALSVWPNPAQDELSVQCLTLRGTLCISESSGRELARIPFAGTDRIPLAALAAGHYTCVLIGADGALAHARFVKL